MTKKLTIEIPKRICGNCKWAGCPACHISDTSAGCPLHRFNDPFEAIISDAEVEAKK